MACCGTRRNPRITRGCRRRPRSRPIFSCRWRPSHSVVLGRADRSEPPPPVFVASPGGAPPGAGAGVLAVALVRRARVARAAPRGRGRAFRPRPPAGAPAVARGHTVPLAQRAPAVHGHRPSAIIALGRADGPDGRRLRRHRGAGGTRAPGSQRLRSAQLLPVTEKKIYNLIIK